MDIEIQSITFKKEYLEISEIDFWISLNLIPRSEDILDMSALWKLFLNKESIILSQKYIHGDRYGDVFIDNHELEIITTNHLIGKKFSNFIMKRLKKLKSCFIEAILNYAMTLEDLCNKQISFIFRIENQLEIYLTDDFFISGEGGTSDIVNQVFSSNENSASYIFSWESLTTNDVVFQRIAQPSMPVYMRLDETFATFQLTSNININQEEKNLIITCREVSDIWIKKFPSALYISSCDEYIRHMDSDKLFFIVTVDLFTDPRYKRLSRQERLEPKTKRYLLGMNSSFQNIYIDESTLRLFIPLRCKLLNQECCGYMTHISLDLITSLPCKRFIYLTSFQNEIRHLLYYQYNFMKMKLLLNSNQILHLFENDVHMMLGTPIVDNLFQRFTCWALSQIIPHKKLKIDKTYFLKPSLQEYLCINGCYALYELCLLDDEPSHMLQIMPRYHTYQLNSKIKHKTKCNWNKRYRLLNQAKWVEDYSNAVIYLRNQMEIETLEFKNDFDEQSQNISHEADSIHRMMNLTSPDHVTVLQCFLHVENAHVKSNAIKNKIDINHNRMLQLERKHDTCPICFQDPSSGIVVLKCSHIICLDCFSMLLDTGTSKCATCRYDPEYNIKNFVCIGNMPRDDIISIPSYQTDPFLKFLNGIATWILVPTITHASYIFKILLQGSGYTLFHSKTLSLGENVIADTYSFLSSQEAFPICISVVGLDYLEPMLPLTSSCLQELQVVLVETDIWKQENLLEMIHDKLCNISAMCSISNVTWIEFKLFIS